MNQTSEMSEKRYIANPNFLLREISGEYVLVPIGDVGELSNSVISLNDSCRFIWQQFLTSKTIVEVVNEAKKEYDDPSGQMEQEIYECVAAYVQHGLLQEV